MERVNFPLLKSVIQKPSADKRLAKDSSICLDQFMNMISNLISVGKSLSESEISLLTISFQQFLNHKSNPTRYVYNGDIELGDIFNINCGLRYDPELSYDHPALVLAKVEELFLVIPSSTSLEKIENAYNSPDNSHNTWYYYKVDQTDGFSERCSLILGNSLIISKHAFLTKEGHVTQDISDANSTFQKIRKLMMENIFGA